MTQYRHNSCCFAQHKHERPGAVKQAPALRVSLCEGPGLQQHTVRVFRLCLAVTAAILIQAQQLQQLIAQT